MPNGSIVEQLLFAEGLVGLSREAGRGIMAGQGIAKTSPNAHFPTGRAGIFCAAKIIQWSSLLDSARDAI
eukprot:364818-Chlamydomonas_euryale.AAC.19